MSGYTIIYVSFHEISSVFINPFLKISVYFTHVFFITTQTLDCVNFSISFIVDIVMRLIDEKLNWF